MLLLAQLPSNRQTRLYPLLYPYRLNRAMNWEVCQEDSSSWLNLCVKRVYDLLAGSAAMRSAVKISQNIIILFIIQARNVK